MAKTDGDIVFKDAAVIKVLYLQKNNMLCNPATIQCSQISDHQKYSPCTFLF